MSNYPKPMIGAIYHWQTPKMDSPSVHIVAKVYYKTEVSGNRMVLMHTGLELDLGMFHNYKQHGFYKLIGHLPKGMVQLLYDSSERN